MTGAQVLLQVPVLTGPGPAAPAFSISPADSAADLARYRRIRHEVFGLEQGIFPAGDGDDIDDDPRTVVLLARDAGGEIIGGVRLSPVGAQDIGWWTGSRLALTPAGRRLGGAGGALVRAAVEHARAHGALRFEACVQAAHRELFQRWGWLVVADTDLHGHPHVTMRYPIDRVQRLVDATKAGLAGLLDGLRAAENGLGAAGFVGDDGSPVPGSDLVAACDAILPSMVERDPEWAGWCAVLVNVNDLTAMGAEPVGLLDALGARDAAFARRVIAGLRDASQAWGVPVLGGHTQLGVPAALSVTALGRTSRPVPAGGGRPGDRLTLTADLGGGWRPGYTGAQWDSTSGRTTDELRALARSVAAQAPAAAKDVSMAGLVGTVGMLAEASGCAAVLDVADVPRPDGVAVGDWFTCFPGFAMITADRRDRSIDIPDRVPATRAACGELAATQNFSAAVSLRWPDGAVTPAVSGAVTGLGAA